MRAEILAGRSPRGEYRSFIIRDPKQRLIHAACFADRVLHHAILNLAEPVFERSLLPVSYACRPGRGVHAAIRVVQAHLRRWPWFVKVDVDGYFPSIEHARLLGLLERRFKGEPFLRLLARIVASCPASPGRGLPIGALTSQHFANLYLDGADRWLQAQPAVQANLRYMDDIIWWCPDRDSARQTRSGLADWLAAERGLTLKPRAQVGRGALGVTYCGARVLPGTIRLTLRKRRRYAERRQAWEDAWEAGHIDAPALQRGYDAVLAVTRAFDARGWRREQLARRPSGYDQSG